MNSGDKINVTINTKGPTVALIADMRIENTGLEQMVEWVKDHRPECMPDDYSGTNDLFPHDLTEDGRELTHNELLVELAGRKCYDSFGVKAGRKSNSDYILHTQAGEVPHASILYHAKMTFFLGGVSRRVSHEFIRNYVGSDRNEEGSPSQESTRFTHHYGWFVAPPRYIGDERLMAFFTKEMSMAYGGYAAMIFHEINDYKIKNDGREPKGLERKRIYEAAAGLLPMQSETSWVWTTNPMALAKMVRERTDESADLEFRRLAETIARVAYARSPNLFPQPWMKQFAAKEST